MPIDAGDVDPAREAPIAGSIREPASRHEVALKLGSL